MCETLRYWAEQRHTIYSATIVNVRACGMFLFSSQSFTPPVWEQVCEERRDLTQSKQKIVGKTVVFACFCFV